MADESIGRKTADCAISPTACGACNGSPSRRRFLGQLTGLALTAVVGSDASRLEAAGVPVTTASGIRAGATRHRYPVPAADGATIDRDLQVIVVRFGARVYAFNLACPHENTALRWRQRDARFQCPRHESKYQPDGTFISGRATRNMDRFSIEPTDGGIIVDVGRLYRSDEQPAEWAAALVAL